MEEEPEMPPRPSVPPAFVASVFAKSVGRAADDLIDLVVNIEAMISNLQALQLVVVDNARRFAMAAAPLIDPAARGWSPEVVAKREFQSELAAAMRISERAAENLVGESEVLVHALPATWDALRLGEITVRHARAIIENTVGVPDEQRESFEAVLLERARITSVAKFDRFATAERERLRPETIEQRHVQAVKDMCVTVTPERDGMALLTAHLPALMAIGIHDRLTRIARQARTAGVGSVGGSKIGSGDERRRIGRLRADAFTELLLNGVVPADAGDGLGVGVRARQPTSPVCLPTPRPERCYRLVVTGTSSHKPSARG